MRDFRDAKLMARALRDALKAKAIETTHAEALELIAKAFGYENWNILSAKIEAAEPAGAKPPASDEGSLSITTSRAAAPPSESLELIAQAVGVGDFSPAFSADLSSTLHRALACANQRKHQYATLEHLLLALIDDVDASAVMNACKVDLGALKEHLTNYIDKDLKKLVIDDGGVAKLTAGFQRGVQRAVLYAQGRERPTLTGAELLVAIFAETESPAEHLLREQGMTRPDAVNFIIHGIVKGGGGTAA